MELANFTSSPIHSLPTLSCPTFHPCLVTAAYKTRFLLCLVPPSLPSSVGKNAIFAEACYSKMRNIPGVYKTHELRLTQDI